MITNHSISSVDMIFDNHRVRFEVITYFLYTLKYVISEIMNMDFIYINICILSLFINT